MHVPSVWLTGPGHAVAPVPFVDPAPDAVLLRVRRDRPRQTLFGIGGALTQASAHALSALSASQRARVLAALFGPEGAAYSLCRTPVASCDFSTSSYTYAPDPDPSLAGFSIEVDRQNGHLALLRDALAVPGARFELIGSAWTAPPWMKDNGLYFDPAERKGGKLLPEHHDTFARYLVRWLEAYAAEGVPVGWLTPLNEPHGNHGQWESMEMSAQEQRDFVVTLSRALHARGLAPRILVYDQNRREMQAYADAVLSDPIAARSAFGIAVHWYDSTFKVYERELDALAAAYPGHPILHTEGCIDTIFGRGKDRGPDAPLPWWQDDGWYWRPEATDWGFDWASEAERPDHPPYAAAFRYARDLVGGLGHHLAGWVDWNIALDKHGGPNHVGNFCLAPVLVDGPSDTVYFTPLFHVMRQVSRHSRPGAQVLEVDADPVEGLWATALRDPSGDHVVHVFNEAAVDRTVRVDLGAREYFVRVPNGSLVTARVE